MDFVKILSRKIEKGERKGEMEVYPDFRVGRSKYLMVRGRSFYAIWDEENSIWSTDEYDVQRIVDSMIYEEVDRIEKQTGIRPKAKTLGSYGSNSWKEFKSFVQNISDNSTPLDEELTFADDEVKRDDFVSKKLPYPLAPGDYSAWDELVGTLYDNEERAKIEWAIGAVVSGDAKKIQKFLVLYGLAGTGKSTVLNIIEKLFEGYTTTFEAKSLASNAAAFATEVFKGNPLVAIQQDGDLSRIEDNTKLNSVISHEMMTMNEKFKPSYDARVNAFLFMGTNMPVKISDAKSGIIRRLIDVHPTGKTLPANHYYSLVSKVDFELGAIAHHCLQVYREMGRNFYNSYRPIEMMYQTDPFFNFMESYFDLFKDQDYITVKHAYMLYKEYCTDSGIEKPMPMHRVRTQLEDYFEEFVERVMVSGVELRSVYRGFKVSKFRTAPKEDDPYSLVIEDEVSLLDEILQDMPAQTAKEDEFGALIPRTSWKYVKTKLSDIDTKQLHFVKIPENLIVIDFDLKDETGAKSLERNLEAASTWPSTYAELSQGGSGVHLHYYWTGSAPVDLLAQAYDENIEVKTLLGDASLRRRVTKCNTTPIAELNTGLALKEKKVLSDNTIKSERGLRDLIDRNIRKEIHPGTKPSIDFIKKILDDAYASGMPYDVSDYRPVLIGFANNSSNQAVQSIRIVQQMKWKSEEAISEAAVVNPDEPHVKQEFENDEAIAFFDVEVYPNLFVICWKFAGPDAKVVRMINPSPSEVEQLFNLKLVGYNNRRYDNHILYARAMGYDNKALYNLSSSIVDNVRTGMFGEAYSLSYADIYDFTSLKQSLKKYQIQLGLPHIELDIPWDQDAPPELWDRIADYCANDVVTTEATFNSREQDFIARKILADLSGLTVNDPTPKHTARIVFGKEREPQKSFVYTDLSTMFPGYTYDFGKSSYRGLEPSEGGYVYAEPGYYEEVGVLDVASMHPTSLINLNAFGQYTPNFKALLDARLAIKREDYETARTLLNGKLAPHLGNVADAEALSYALKIVINIVYGLTSARFENPFKDVRNKDNIVAKRGALFMIDLQLACQEKGWTVVHIKTDSIKLANMTEEMKTFVVDFGKKYGYDFEHESTYSKMSLVNDAVYIAKVGWAQKAKKIGKWEAVGKQFQHPYVYKRLFTQEVITFDDMCETKQVMKGSMYLDLEYDRPAALPEGMKYIGKHGQFVPLKEGYNGGRLYVQRPGEDEKMHAVTGTKSWLWAEATFARTLPPEAIDLTYFDHLVGDAAASIERFVALDQFIDETK